jgi:hypothetical protein
MALSYPGIDGVFRIDAVSIVRVESQFDDRGFGNARLRTQANFDVAQILAAPQRHEGHATKC